MDNYSKENSLIGGFKDPPVIYLVVTILLITLALRVLDADSIIMKKILFFLDNKFYLEYIVRFIRTSVFFLGLTVVFFYFAFFEKTFDSMRSRVIVATIMLAMVIFSAVFLANYIRDLETVKNSSYETCIVKNSSVEITKGEKHNYYYVKTSDGKELVLTNEQYSIAKKNNENYENAKKKICVYYLKNSKTVLKIESYDG